MHCCGALLHDCVRSCAVFISTRDSLPAVATIGHGNFECKLVFLQDKQTVIICHHQLLES